MNLQNFRIGVSSNLHVVIEGTFIIMWAGFQQNMFSPFNFGEHIVAGVLYLDTWREFLMAVLEEEGPNNIRYQQYFIPSNFHNAVWDLTQLFLLHGVHKECCLCLPFCWELLRKYKLLYVQLTLYICTNVSAEHDYRYMCWATRSDLMDHL
jgi:hypothetical protein